MMLQMGTADVIVDLVSSGTTLRENNLKEVEGGTVLESQVSSTSFQLFCFFDDISASN
jgi:ATP phosphoribosyltransferase